MAEKQEASSPVAPRTAAHAAHAASQSAVAVRLACRGLSRSHKSGASRLEVLSDVDLDVHAGEFVAIVGPSGSGKSTLLALLAGLDRPDRGEVLWDGQSLAGLDEDGLARWRRGRVGFVFQSFQLFGHLTARENVLLPLDIAGVDAAPTRADKLLKEVGLGARGHHYPSQLSGGEQQRVALARAFAGAPQLLLADEPTGNLDPANGRAILEQFARLRAEYGTTVVLVTHDRDVAALADRRVHLEAGRVVRIEGHRAP